MTKKQLTAWKGKFGDDYLRRNQYDPSRRMRDFHMMVPADVRNALEVGSSYGNNIQTLWGMSIHAMGIEPNTKAVEQAFKLCRPVFKGDAYNLPFEDCSFDLVFTCGVLEHIPDENLEKAMNEIWRVSRRYVLAIEYEGENEEIVYRGNKSMLWKRRSYPYPGRCIKSGKLGSSFDRSSFWLYGKE